MALVPGALGAHTGGPHPGVRRTQLSRLLSSSFGTVSAAGQPGFSSRLARAMATELRLGAALGALPPCTSKGPPPRMGGIRPPPKSAARELRFETSGAETPEVPASPQPVSCKLFRTRPILSVPDPRTERWARTPISANGSFRRPLTVSAPSSLSICSGSVTSDVIQERGVKLMEGAELSLSAVSLTPLSEPLRFSRILKRWSTNLCPLMCRMLASSSTILRNVSKVDSPSSSSVSSASSSFSAFSSFAISSFCSSSFFPVLISGNAEANLSNFFRKEPATFQRARPCRSAFWCFRFKCFSS
mmetsp:Transcript_50875/g.108973  ORF Transcript_50875/g.108973 Transcript_50875/m.108973 type:complete len:302 (-) Transcript_50875:68-973(-)